MGTAGGSLSQMLAAGGVGLFPEQPAWSLGKLRQVHPCAAPQDLLHPPGKAAAAGERVWGWIEAPKGVWGQIETPKHFWVWVEIHEAFRSELRPQSVFGSGLRPPKGVWVYIEAPKHVWFWTETPKAVWVQFETPKCVWVWVETPKQVWLCTELELPWFHGLVLLFGAVHSISKPCCSPPVPW